MVGERPRDVESRSCFTRGCGEGERRSCFTRGCEGDRRRLSTQTASLEADRPWALLEADRLSRHMASFDGEESGRLRLSLELEEERFNGDLARSGGGLTCRLRFSEVSDGEMEGERERICDSTVSWDLARGFARQLLDLSWVRLLCCCRCERWSEVNIGFGTSSG